MRTGSPGAVGRSPKPDCKTAPSRDFSNGDLPLKGEITFTRMGDGSSRWAGDNRCPHIDRKDRNMLEWKPRLIALIIVVVLVGLLAGFAESTDFISPDNWEW
jgi:hypothetical protein